MSNNLIVCGGTFDHLHKGHVSLLKLAFSLGKKVVVGITSDNYVKNSKFKIQNSELMGSFWERKKAVEEFLKQEGVLERAEIIEINDVFGPTLSKDLQIDAIVVSDDTKKGAEVINEERKKLGLKDLKIIVAPSVYAEDGKLISSGRIRNGEIDRHGKIYVKPIWLEKNLHLPENLRKEFQNPFGILVNNLDQEKFKDEDLIITVGDVTTKKLNVLNIKKQISVIDFKVARERKFSDISELGFKGSEKIFKANNPAGYVTFDLFGKITEILKLKASEKIILQVNGEEDLAVLPLVLTASLNTIIYYGQPGQGLVKIVASEKSKDKAYELIRGFQILDSSLRSE